MAACNYSIYRYGLSYFQNRKTQSEHFNDQKVSGTSQTRQKDLAQVGFTLAETSSTLQSK